MESESLMGKNVGDKVDGKDIKPDFEGYEFEISGASDTSGFPLSKNVEGIALKGVLLTKGFGMKENIEGLRKKKTLRGKVITNTTSQINFSVLKQGHKKLAEIFPEQNKPKVEEKVEAKPVNTPAVA